MEVKCIYCTHCAVTDKKAGKGHCYHPDADKARLMNILVIRTCKLYKIGPKDSVTWRLTQ